MYTYTIGELHHFRDDLPYNFLTWLGMGFNKTWAGSLGECNFDGKWFTTHL